MHWQPLKPSVVFFLFSLAGQGHSALNLHMATVLPRKTPVIHLTVFLVVKGPKLEELCPHRQSPCSLQLLQVNQRDQQK